MFFFLQKTNSSPALFVASTGMADQVTFQVDEGTPVYYNYVLQQNLFDEYWDDVAKVPYALGKNGLNTFLSFDNERSIAEKAKYVIDHDLSGVIIWEITGDYLETSPGSGVIGSTPLADTLNAVLCHYTGETTAALDEQQLNVSIYPNPSEDHLTITSSKAIQHLVITQVSGELVEEIDCKEKFIYKFSTDQLKSGVYLIELTTQEGVFIQRFIKN